LEEAPARWRGCGAAVFSGGTGKDASREAAVSDLYAEIGQVTVEWDSFITDVRAIIGPGVSR
jgi:hypothetical protein